MLAELAVASISWWLCKANRSRQSYRPPSSLAYSTSENFSVMHKNFHLFETACDRFAWVEHLSKQLFPRVLVGDAVEVGAALFHSIGHVALVALRSLLKFNKILPRSRSPSFVNANCKYSRRTFSSSVLQAEAVSCAEANLDSSVQRSVRRPATTRDEQKNEQRFEYESIIG